MDTDEKPRRSLYRRKRTWAAAALLLMFGYLASIGPVVYAYNRMWVPDGVALHYCTPALWSAENLPAGIGEPYGAYVMWWGNLAAKHWLESDDPLGDLD